MNPVPASTRPHEKVSLKVAIIAVLALTSIQTTSNAQGSLKSRHAESPLLSASSYIRCVQLHTPLGATFAAETLVCQKCFAKYPYAEATPNQDAADIVQLAAVARMLHIWGEGLGDGTAGLAKVRDAEQEYFGVLETLRDGPRGDHPSVTSELLSKYVKSNVDALGIGFHGNTTLMGQLMGAASNQLTNGLIDLRQEEHPNEPREVSEMYVYLLLTATRQ
jgi:hypothetical protein